VAFTIVLVVLALSVAVTSFVDFRAAATCWRRRSDSRAVFRAVLPERYCLGLLVRTRRMDVVTGGHARGRRGRRRRDRPGLIGHSPYVVRHRSDHTCGNGTLRRPGRTTAGGGGVSTARGRDLM
jgi:hypothetical protein